MNMVRSKNDEALRADCSGQELNEDQLSAVIGAALTQLTGLRRLPFPTTAMPVHQVAPLVAHRVPVVRPEQTSSIFQQFDFGGVAAIPPDLEEPKWPKPGPAPKDPPIPPDLEEPKWPTPPPPSPKDFSFDR
jgi:hypothetical protein